MPLGGHRHLVAASGQLCAQRPHKLFFTADDRGVELSQHQDAHERLRATSRYSAMRSVVQRSQVGRSRSLAGNNGSRS